MLYRIELFAEFMALLEEPFSDRASVLSAAELDDARLGSMLEAWRIRLEGDEKGELAEKYAAAYSARGAAIHGARARATSGEAERVDPRFLTQEALGFREEAARVGREPLAESMPNPVSPGPRAEPSGVFVAPVPPLAPTPPSSALPPAAPRGMPSYVRPSERLAGTADISSVVRSGALPFARDAGAEAPRAQRAAPSPSPNAVRIGSGTEDISSFVPRHLLPFSGNGTPPPAGGAPPAATSAPLPAPGGRPKRMIRFDPQTGQPLPAPIWVDIPEEPKK